MPRGRKETNERREKNATSVEGEEIPCQVRRRRLWGKRQVR